MARMFGYLPQPPADYLRRYVERTAEEAAESTRRSGGRSGRGKVMPKEIRLYPDNIRFRHADWVQDEIEDDKKGYDLILA